MVRQSVAHTAYRQHHRGPMGWRQAGRQKASHYGINLIDPGHFSRILCPDDIQPKRLSHPDRPWLAPLGLTGKAIARLLWPD